MFALDRKDIYEDVNHAFCVAKKLLTGTIPQYKHI
jgi:hypothetical protein